MSGVNDQITEQELVSVMDERTRIGYALAKQLIRSARLEQMVADLTREVEQLREKQPGGY